MVLRAFVWSWILIRSLVQSKQLQIVAAVDVVVFSYLFISFVITALHLYYAGRIHSREWKGAVYPSVRPNFFLMLMCLAFLSKGWYTCFTTFLEILPVGPYTRSWHCWIIGACFGSHICFVSPIWQCQSIEGKTEQWKMKPSWELLWSWIRQRLIFKAVEVTAHCGLFFLIFFAIQVRLLTYLL